jgi:hypothetical protein
MVEDVADLSGIPPQYLKGQIEQESAVGQITQNGDQQFVYEPCRDFERGVSMSDPPYNGFTAPNPRGSLLTNADLSPRNKYRIIPVGPNGRPLPPARPMNNADHDVTIANIFANNDCTRRDASGVCHGANWSATCPGVARRIRANNYANAQLVAQTPVFSSYGRGQSMYTSAEDPSVSWAVADPAIPGLFLWNPSLLFDTGVMFYAGAGSMTVGGHENVMHWKTAMHNYGDPSSYTTLNDYRTQLARMFRLYNPAWHSTTYSRYDAAVLDRARHFLPIRAGAILGN